MMFTIFWVGCAAVGLLWASEVGPEILEEIAHPQTTAPLSDTLKVQKSARLDTRKKTGKDLKIPPSIVIDKSLFLNSFAKQALRYDLRLCLKQTMNVSTGDIALAGVLNRGGQLSDIRIVGSDKQLSLCAKEIIEKMNFSQITGQVEPAGHTVYWRVDW